MDAESEEEAVRQLGNRIGYGRMMHLASKIWGEIMIQQGHPGAEFTVGPCAAFMRKCTHPLQRSHCPVCCGSGRVTEWVAKVINGS